MRTQLIAAAAVIAVAGFAADASAAQKNQTYVAPISSGLTARTSTIKPTTATLAAKPTTGFAAKPAPAPILARDAAGVLSHNGSAFRR